MHIYNNKIKVNKLLAHLYGETMNETIVISFNFLFWLFRDRIPETVVFFFNTLSFAPPILLQATVDVNISESSSHMCLYTFRSDACSQCLNALSQ